MSTPPNPISLSDAQLTAVMTAAGPLHPADRDLFLRALADRLRGEELIGDGNLARAIRETLSSGFFKPPTVTEPQGPRPTARSRDAKPIWASAQK